MLRAMRTAVFYRLISLLLALVRDALRFLVLGTHSQAALKAENLFLRKQLALYLEREVKPRRATDATRLSMVLLSRLFTWQNALAVSNRRPFSAGIGKDSGCSGAGSQGHEAGRDCPKRYRN